MQIGRGGIRKSAVVDAKGAVVTRRGRGAWRRLGRGGDRVEGQFEVIGSRARNNGQAGDEGGDDLGRRGGERVALSQGARRRLAVLAGCSVCVR